MYRIPTLAYLVLAGAIPAQSYSYSPQRYAAQPGGGFHDRLGTTAGGRYMLMDGQFRGLPMGIKEISFRPNWAATGVLKRRSKPLGTFAGRSWKQVSLKMSRCDALQASEVFSSNPTSPPTTVYQGAMSWPDVSTFTTARPLPFHVHFPLQTVWQHTGAEDICMDFEFSGGVLNSTQQWPSGAVYSYPLGSYYLGRFAIAGGNMLLGYEGKSQGCVDSGPGNQVGAATTSMWIWSYSPKHPTPSFRNKVTVSMSAFGVEGNVLLAAGVDGRFDGVPLSGVSCNELFLDLSKPLFLVPARAQNQLAQYTTGFFPHYSTLVGIGLWGQSAWRDSVTNDLKITAATVSLVPDLPLDPPAIRAMTYQADPAKRTAGQVAAGSQQPVLRYAR